jgi:hypothetical protein
MKRLMFLAALLLFLSGCAGFSKVGPGPTTIGAKMTVELIGPWNKLDGPGLAPAELWTMEGLSLDNLVFYPGLKDGTALGQMAQRKEKEMPKFRTSMQPHDIVEMYEAFVTNDGSSFRLEKLAPSAFVGTAGFRFDFTLTRKRDEVVLKGVGFGAVREGDLYLMVYRAPRLYYFPKYLPAVEAIARSARPTG